MRERPENPIFGPESPRLDPPDPPEVSTRRSLAKAISWRVVGTIDTFVLSFVILSFIGPLVGMAPASHGETARVATWIALTEVATKLVLYYLHERGWARVGWQVGTDDEGHRAEGPTRSAVKTGTWRVLASLDTMILALIFSGSLATAVSIGGLEVITKMVLYYVHERAWRRVRWGIEAT